MDWTGCHFALWQVDFKGFWGSGTLNHQTILKMLLIFVSRKPICLGPVCLATWRCHLLASLSPPLPPLLWASKIYTISSVHRQYKTCSFINLVYFLSRILLSVFISTEFSYIFNSNYLSCLFIHLVYRNINIANLHCQPFLIATFN